MSDAAAHVALVLRSQGFAWARMNRSSLPPAISWPSAVVTVHSTTRKVRWGGAQLG